MQKKKRKKNIISCYSCYKWTLQLRSAWQALKFLEQNWPPMSHKFFIMSTSKIEFKIIKKNLPHNSSHWKSPEILSWSSLTRLWVSDCARPPSHEPGRPAARRQAALRCWRGQHETFRFTTNFLASKNVLRFAKQIIYCIGFLQKSINSSQIA